jgi:ADP-heptose:LPS heptosyltransferase
VNATLMRLLDKTIGRMMCALLAAWHRLRRPHVPKHERIERLLVIKLIGLGTIMLSSALTKGLRQYRPHLQIDFLTLEGFRDAAKLTGTVDRVYTLNLRAPISSVWRTIRQLRANRYQMVMDLDYFSCASMILACLSGAPRRVGFISPGYERWDLLTHIVLYSTALHIPTATD